MTAKITLTAFVPVWGNSKKNVTFIWPWQFVEKMTMSYVFGHTQWFHAKKYFYLNRSVIGCWLVVLVAPASVIAFSGNPPNWQFFEKKWLQVTVPCGLIVVTFCQNTEAVTLVFVTDMILCAHRHRQCIITYSWKNKGKLIFVTNEATSTDTTQFVTKNSGHSKPLLAPLQHLCFSLCVLWWCDKKLWSTNRVISIHLKTVLSLPPFRLSDMRQPFVFAVTSYEAKVWWNFRENSGSSAEKLTLTPYGGGGGVEAEEDICAHARLLQFFQQPARVQTYRLYGLHYVMWVVSVRDNWYFWQLSCWEHNEIS